ncbi:unnamed protein product [Boreogadus saida]
MRLVVISSNLCSDLSDGQWHDVRLVAKENFAMLTIDGDEASAVQTSSPLSITTGGTYHLGGKADPKGTRRIRESI